MTQGPPMMDTKATSPTPSPALLTRLKAASGPDPQLDRDLGAFFGLGPSDDRTRDPWPYTASLDAALALVERVLPGWVIELQIGGTSLGATASIAPKWWNPRFEEDASDAGGIMENALTRPLTVLIALLTALQAQQEEGR